MNERSDPNLERLLATLEALGPLADEIVLVGGCTTGLLLTDPGAAPIRPTIDVDVVVDALTYAQYHLLETQLRSLGFEQRAGEDDPICRWWHGEHCVDVMPVGDFLGFTNPWYASACRHALVTELRELRLRHVDGPHFLATKLAAYLGRGGGDPVTSHDIEDVVLLIDGRPELEGELRRAPMELRSHVATVLASVLRDRFFVEGLEGYFDRAIATERCALVISRMERLIEMQD